MDSQNSSQLPLPPSLRELKLSTTSELESLLHIRRILVIGDRYTTISTTCNGVGEAAALLTNSNVQELDVAAAKVLVFADGDQPQCLSKLVTQLLEAHMDAWRFVSEDPWGRDVRASFGAGGFHIRRQAPPLTLAFPCGMSPAQLLALTTACLAVHDIGWAVDETGADVLVESAHFQQTSGPTLTAMQKLALGAAAPSLQAYTALRLEGFHSFDFTGMAAPVHELVIKDMRYHYMGIQLQAGTVVLPTQHVAESVAILGGGVCERCTWLAIAPDIEIAARKVVLCSSRAPSGCQKALSKALESMPCSELPIKL
ncbi:hypothetical protein WJX72_007071 [[Myrmecia] bisecta]|uniref:Uncharacterized protein n=1 Tax=[Myrmecia] bisecta TaxID=41462 RepID=A0AAW1QFP5_9CHLO